MTLMQRCFLVGCLLSVVLLFPAASPVRADVTGTILGNVTDPSGAAVPGAAVTLSDASKGFRRETVTDSDRVLSIPGCPGRRELCCGRGGPGIQEVDPDRNKAPRQPEV